jgi:hypothetical protein
MVNATRTLAVLLVFLMTGTAVAQDTLNTPTWTIDPADVAWMSTASHVRGGVVNPATGHLLVASREGGVSVQVLNPATGASIGTLNVTDVAGGTFAINKIVATTDGQIFASNVVSPAATEELPFKIYWWANERPRRWWCIKACPQHTVTEMHWLSAVLAPISLYTRRDPALRTSPFSNSTGLSSQRRA